MTPERKRKWEKLFDEKVVVIGLSSDTEREAAKKGLLTAMIRHDERAVAESALAHPATEG